MLLIAGLFGIGALWQLRGLDLWLSLSGLGLGVTFVLGSQAVLQTFMLESAKKTVDQRQLCQLLTRMLRS